MPALDQLLELLNLLYNYLYSIVVFPAPSKPRIRILISFEPNKDENKFEKNPPVEQTNQY
jgi:hypothetical protein